MRSSISNKKRPDIDSPAGADRSSPVDKIVLSGSVSPQRSRRGEEAGGSVDILSAARIAARRWVRALDLPGVMRLKPARLAIFALNGLVHLLSVYRDLDGGRDPQSNFIAANIHDGDNNIIANDDTLVAVSGQDQHR